MNEDPAPMAACFIKERDHSDSNIDVSVTVIAESNSDIFKFKAALLSPGQKRSPY